jgi:hypothetical protein
VDQAVFVLVDLRHGEAVAFEDSSIDLDVFAPVEG